VFWRLLADATVAIHLAFVLFVIFGGFLAWRWRWMVYLHVPALLWGAWIEFVGGICPLTPLENRLRLRAGESGYEGGFIEHYIEPLIYPAGLTRETQWVLLALLLAINALAYGRLLARARRRRSG